MARTRHNYPLIFLHIYKTAGTTLRDIITRNYRKDEMCWLGSHLDKSPFLDLPEEKRNTLSLLYGHMLFGLHRNMKPGARYITVIRNPADRIISEYYYNMAHPEFPDHAMLVEKGITDPLLFARNSGFILADNGQVRILSEAYEKPVGTIDEADYNRAIENINQYFDFIATTRHFDALVLMMAEKYGWRTPYYTRMNQGEKKPEVSAEMRNEILALNPWDVKLCDFVEQRMEGLMAAKGKSWETKLGKFRERNRRLSWFLKARVHAGLLFSRAPHS